MTRSSLSGFKLRAPFLDVQTKNGVGETYSGQFTVSQNPVSDNTGGGAQPMRLLWTPPVDAWWEVWGNIGIVVKVDAAYHYLYGGIYLTPNDVDGQSSSQMAVQQHSQVNVYEGRTAHRLFKLAGGTAYTCNLGLIGPSGGTWQYYCGPGQLWINGLGWAR